DSQRAAVAAAGSGRPAAHAGGPAALRAAVLQQRTLRSGVLRHDPDDSRSVQRGGVFRRRAGAGDSDEQHGSARLTGHALSAAAGAGVLEAPAPSTVPAAHRPPPNLKVTPPENASWLE